MTPNGQQWERKTHLLTGRKHQQNQAQGGGHLSLGANRSWNPTCSHLSVGAPAESLPFISPAFPAQLNFTVNISVSLDVGRRQRVSQNEFQETKSSVKCLKLSATPPPFACHFLHTQTAGWWQFGNLQLQREEALNTATGVRTPL